MKRREVFAVLGGAALALPTDSHAQEQIKRIGVLMSRYEQDSDGQAFTAALREGLQRLGWTEGHNLRIDMRWAKPTDPESIQRFAKELIALQPDLILSAATPTTAALLQETRTVPIIFATASDPVGSGFVTSFPRPGGNVTGFSNIDPTTAGKWLELLKEIAPRVARVGFLFNPATAPYAENYLSFFQSAAASFAVQAIATPVRDRSELESIFTGLAREPNGGLVVMTDTFMSNLRTAKTLGLDVPMLLQQRADEVIE